MHQSIRSSGIAVLLSALLVAACTGAPWSAPYDLVITNVAAVDAAGGMRPAQTVAVRDGWIELVQPASEPTPNATTSIDGTGHFLIPGLWDMHVHITYELGLTGQMADRFLDYGVTSVRDTGGLLPLLQPEIERWRAPDAVAPRIYFSGPLLDGTKVVYNGVGRSEIGIANASVQTAVANIEALASAGVDFVKVYELVSPEVFAALVTAARERNLPIAAHVPLSMTADVAGPRVDSMEHLRNVELACSPDADALHAQRQAVLADSGDLSGYELRFKLHSEQHARAQSASDVNSERCQRVIASLRHTIQVPTLRLNALTTYPLVEKSDWLALVAALPEPLATDWQAFASTIAERTEPPDSGRADWSLAAVGAMHAAGVPIGAGTDTPIGFAIPGYSLHTELERLVDAGLSTQDALASATVRPAEFMGLQYQMGSIKAGMLADLVLLSADPLADISNTRAIKQVISKGRVVRRF